MYSINLFFTTFIMIDKLFSEKHIETTRPHMRTFDTAKASLDLILSLTVFSNTTNPPRGRRGSSDIFRETCGGSGGGAPRKIFTILLDF